MLKQLRLDKNKYASTLELAYRSRNTVEEIENMAAAGELPGAIRLPGYGWAVDRVAAEQFIEEVTA